MNCAFFESALRGKAMETIGVVLQGVHSELVARNLGVDAFCLYSVFLSRVVWWWGMLRHHQIIDAAAFLRLMAVQAQDPTGTFCGLA